jgi:YjjI family glycine radical enzyme
MTDTPFGGITRDPRLSPGQKAHALAVAAENSLPYPALEPETQAALAARIICDMYEGHAPYKPRYVLPDYAVPLRQGSAWLELPVPRTLDEALNTLMIVYHHVPSVTGMPVYIGQLDDLLLPFCDGVSEADLLAKLRLFWRYLDRVLPDAFMHANIGPSDNRVARAILAVDAELKQIAPNLTFRHDPMISRDAILRQCTANIIACSKPHVANHPLHRAAFDAVGYGIVSCYNALPLRGGASTLVRLNLLEVARRSDSVADFLDRGLPQFAELAARLIEARVGALTASGFFRSFLVQEGWIDEDRFTAMFGIFAMAEAVNHLQDRAGFKGRYGHEAGANALGLAITERLAGLVAAREIAGVWRGRAMLHAQAGLSTDTGLTPGIRIPYGTEPDPVSHVQALMAQHGYFPAGVSEILTLDETVRANPEAVFRLAKGALAGGLREFTANVGGNDLVRVTGYMVKLSDLARHRAGGMDRTNTTALGTEAAAMTAILHRRPRVVAGELMPPESLAQADG